MTWWLTATAIARASTVPVLQVAADGSWENALVVAAGDVTAARAALGAIVPTARSDVAVEALWPGQSFVGVRWSLDQLDAAAAGVEAAASVLQAAGARTATPAAALLALLGAGPSPRADLVELGAVNAWASVGAQTLWRRGDPLVATLDDLTARRPDLARCTHPVAVEVAAVEPRPCWVGVVVSQPAGLLHVLDVAAVARVLACAA